MTVYKANLKSGSVVLTVGQLTFVFSTILGWSYYGEEAVEYLFGIRAVKPYRWGGNGRFCRHLAGRLVVCGGRLRT